MLFHEFDESYSHRESVQREARGIYFRTCDTSALRSAWEMWKGIMEARAEEESEKVKEGKVADRIEGMPNAPQLIDRLLYFLQQ